MNLPSNKYWVTAGAALVIYGVKETTRDIDIGCTTDLIEEFIDKGCKYKITDKNLRIVKVNDQIELLENWFVDEIEFIEELPIASLESIKKQKLELGRDKDYKDIKLIDEYIEKKRP